MQESPHFVQEDLSPPSSSRRSPGPQEREAETGACRCGEASPDEDTSHGIAAQRQAARLLGWEEDQAKVYNKTPCAAIGVSDLPASTAVIQLAVPNACSCACRPAAGVASSSCWHWIASHWRECRKGVLQR